MRLSLAQRELARLGRSRRVYAWRTVMAGAFTVVVMFEWMIHHVSFGHRYFMRPEVLGVQLAYWCQLAEIVLVVVIMPLLTAPLIAAERRDEGLSLLLLADFRGWDIFAAKFLTAFLEAAMLLLCLAPIQLLTTFFGGVSPDIVLAQMVVLGAVMIYTCCVGLLCSSLMQNAVTAVIATVAMLFVTALAALGIDWFLFTSGLTWNSGSVDALRLFGKDGATVTGHYYRFSVCVLIVAATVALITVLILPRVAVARPRRYWLGAPTPYGHTSRRLLRWGAVQPLLSMHATGLTSTLRTPGVRIAVAAALTAIALVPLVGPMLVVLLLTQEVTVSLINARKSGVTDDLRVTNMDSRSLARDMLQFFARRARPYAPALFVCSWQLGLYFGAVIGGNFSDVVDLIARRYFYGPLFFIGLVTGCSILALAQASAIVAIACALGSVGNDARRHTVLTLLVVGLTYAACMAVASVIGFHVELYRDLPPVPWLSVLIFVGACVAIFWLAANAGRSAFYRIVDRGEDGTNEWMLLWSGFEGVRWHLPVVAVALFSLASMSEIGLVVFISTLIAAIVLYLVRRLIRGSLILLRP